MHPPKIFISATSGDLRSIRQIVKEALLTINCHPVEQTNFEPDARTVENMLRGKIGDCQALIHICGMRYGAEPDVATLPPGTPRRSYTQMEYHIGRQLQEQRGDSHFRVYTFICPEDFPYDPEPDTEPQEKRDLQLDHRSRLFDDPHLREKPRDGDDLKLRVLALQEQVFALEQEQAEVKIEVLKNRHLGLKAFAVLLLLLGGIYGGIHLLQRGQSTLQQGQKKLISAAQPLDAPTLRARLTESSERTLQQELAAADKAAKSADGQRLREAAEAAHASRIARIGDLASRLSELLAAGQASPILVKMLSILDAEGVDAALAYEVKQRPSLIEGIKAATKMDRERYRTNLQPILRAAQFHATKGDSPAARANYEEILAIEPDWPDAIDAFAWFLYDTSVQSQTHGSQRAALADAEAMLALATHRQTVASEEARSLRLLSVAGFQVADILVLRGLPGDTDKALTHYQRGNEILEKLLTANPDSVWASHDASTGLERLGDFLSRRGQPSDAERSLSHYQRSLQLREKLLTSNPASTEDARNVYISLWRLGDFFARRGQPGDAETALAHYQRSLEVCEKLLTTNPNSAQAARDVSISLINLGSLLASRGQPGDAEKALPHYQRNLEICEKLLTANPKSAQATRDVSVSLEKLGDLLVSRGQPGDAEKALARYQRCLELREKLLTANQDSAQTASDVSVILDRLGAFLASRGQPGDAETALANLRRSLEAREKILTASPDSAEAARAVWVSCWRLASLAELTGKGDAAAWWKRAYDILHGMEQKGMFLTPNDKASLEAVRGKVGGK